MVGISLQDRSEARQAGALDITARIERARVVDHRRQRRDRRLSGRLAALDAVALALGWSAGWVAVAWATSGPAPAASLQLDDIVVGVVASMVCFVAFGLYRAPSHGTRSAAPGTIAQALAVAAVAVTGWQAVVGDAAPGIAVGAAGGGFLAVLTGRYAFDVWLLGCRRHGRFLSPVVLAGTPEDTRALATFLDLNPETGFRAAGVVGGTDGADDDVLPVGNADPAGEPDPVPRLGDYGDVVTAVRRTQSTGVLVAVNRIPTGALHDLLSDVSAIGMPVHLSSGLTGFAHSRLRSTPVAHEPFLVLEPLRHTATQRVAKRTIDLVVATSLLLLALPVIAACAVLIKLDDRGPVLFRQTRVGRDGRTFRCLKLRTMSVGAEHQLAALADRNERNGPLFKLEDDPRVTRVGAFMRASALDELPQLLNVLRGEMSIVGPRPALPSEAEEFDVELQKRHVVRPGLTGLWQTEANHKASFDEYRRLDIFYVTNWSVALDLAILANTVPALTHRALAALRRPAPTAPVPVRSSPSAAVPDEGRLATGPVPSSEAHVHSAVWRATVDGSGSRGRGRRPHALIIVQNLPVPLDRRVWMESTALVQAGWDVSVICPRGESDGVRDRRFEEIDGVRIHRYAPPAPATGVVSYAWEFAYCWMRTALLSLRVYRRNRFEVIQACNPPDTYFALARLYKPWGVRFVFDHHDLCHELLTSRDLDTEPPRALMQALYALERATFATADHVITTNETYRDTARGRTRKAFDDFTVVRSAPDPDLMVRGAAVPELRHGRRHLCAYLGIMGHQDGVAMVLQAADVIVNQLGRDDVHFALLGFGDTLEDLKVLASELELDDHVTFTGRVGPPEIGDWLSTADVGLCPDPRTPFTDRSTMNKVLEYMAHELPVVSFDLAETLRCAGPAVRPVTWLGSPEVDAKAFALAIVDLLDDPERGQAMGRQGRARIENGMGWPSQATAYVRALDRLVGRDHLPDQPAAGTPATARPSTRSRDLQGV